MVCRLGQPCVTCFTVSLLWRRRLLPELGSSTWPSPYCHGKQQSEARYTLCLLACSPIPKLLSSKQPHWCWKRAHIRSSMRLSYPLEHRMSVRYIYGGPLRERRDSLLLHHPISLIINRFCSFVWDDKDLELARFQELLRSNQALARLPQHHHIFAYLMYCYHVNYCL